GVTSASQWAAGLVAHGKPPETPVAIVRKASQPQQEVIITTLERMPQTIATAKLRPPAIIIVGEAVAARASLDWFASRPLFGKTVMVTRPVHQSDSLADHFAELGAYVLFQPA